MTFLKYATGFVLQANLTMQLISISRSKGDQHVVVFNAIFVVVGTEMCVLGIDFGHGTSRVRSQIDTLW